MTDEQLETIRMDIAFYAVLGFSIVTGAANEVWWALSWLVFAMLIRMFGKVRLRATSTTSAGKEKE